MGDARSSYCAGTLRLAMRADSGGRSDAPTGWYLAIDVAELVGVQARSIIQWTNHGYIKATRQDGPPHVYSYLDVGEAMMVRELLERRVRPKEIRTAVMNARAEYGDWPLQAADLGVYQGPRRARLGLQREDGLFDIGHATGEQKFIDFGDLAKLASYLRRGGWVIKIHPEIEHIEVDPAKLSGKPTIAGHRVAAAQVAAIAAERGGRRELRDGYDLSTIEINDAVRWAKGVAELQAAA
jgi:uncharacterized protein (DUF433 family)/DNA-binding transcriptional MerR regulator